MVFVEAIGRLLRGCSVEITPGDGRSIDAAAAMLPQGTETFIASLPKGRLDDVVDAAVRLRRAGLVPVPHLAARNLASEEELDDFLKRLSAAAGVDRALVIGGDRHEPLGPYGDSLRILKSGLLQTHGVRSVYLSCYPEGHPRIGDERLTTARGEKLAVCQAAGLTAGLVSQFCFDAAPIVRTARNLRRQGVRNRLRIGLAGPASAAVLLKYAAICGVGPSIRALRERQSLARHVLAGNTEDLVAELARAQAAEPSLGIGGVHFFTFGSLGRTAEMLARLRSRECVT
jgi:methylenetetrahydrofolate reductase (NADPH)